jgi:hydroxymethylbilane synthase
LTILAPQATRKPRPLEGAAAIDDTASMARTFVIGTRGSRLALAQTTLVVDALAAAHSHALFEVREIATQGDRSLRPLSEIGGQGVFTKAIEDALLAGTIDIAVHSMKDLPPRLTDGLVIAAVPARGDPRDALITKEGRTLADLAPGARVGTGSARRAAQLRELRPDIMSVAIRGNVDTRIRKIDDDEYDGIVVAMAGLQRLGLEARATQAFTTEEMVPSPGQGALAVQTRAGDMEAATLVGAIDHADTHAAVDAEREFLAALGAGCQLPVGAFAHFDAEGRLTLATAVGTEDGLITRERRYIRGSS